MLQLQQNLLPALMTSGPPHLNQFVRNLRSTMKLNAEKRQRDILRRSWVSSSSETRASLDNPHSHNVDMEHTLSTDASKPTRGALMDARASAELASRAASIVEYTHERRRKNHRRRK